VYSFNWSRCGAAMASLKSLIPALAKSLEMTPSALYERQRALVRAGLLKAKPGRGRGSGVEATPQSVAMLLIAILATDNLSETERMTKLIAGLKAEHGTCELTGQKTFASVLAALLASEHYVHKVEVLRGEQRARIDIHEAGRSEDYDRSTYFHGKKFKPVVPVAVSAELHAYLLSPIVKTLRGET
jgi:DNA-binding IscR family transcriptional regulator